MKSFEIDHTRLIPGLYQHSKSGLVTTWDVRMKTPNSGEYLTPAVIHTIEHTLASYMRATYGNYRIVGIFPMGCQTGFYILTRFMSKRDIWDALMDYCHHMVDVKEIPGATEIQCGNYELQDLFGAKRAVSMYHRDWLKWQTAAFDYTN